MSAGTFQNPIGDGGDPWVVHAGGYYYLTGTYGDHLAITRAGSLSDLASAPRTEVWRDSETSRCAMMWAPELHLLDGPNGRRWYLYYSACDPVDHHNHRVHVLESTTDTPMGPYRYSAKLQTDPADEFYAIDGSPLQLDDGRLYLVWAGHPGHVLYLSQMATPWELTGRRVHLPADGFGCEHIREGPVFLRRNCRVFLVYSACDTGTPDYRLGMLIAEETSDLMDRRSWEQYPEPVFQRSDANGVFGPGHNGFFASPDGTEDWIAYHGKTVQHFTHEGRTSRAQPFGWTADGLPDFGEPLPLSAHLPLPSGDPGSPRAGWVPPQ